LLVGIAPVLREATGGKTQSDEAVQPVKSLRAVTFNLGAQAEIKLRR
jgi:hypothetical protein